MKNQMTKELNELQANKLTLIETYGELTNMLTPTMLRLLDDKAAKQLLNARANIESQIADINADIDNTIDAIANIESKEAAEQTTKEVKEVKEVAESIDNILNRVEEVIKSEAGQKMGEESSKASKERTKVQLKTELNLLKRIKTYINDDRELNLFEEMMGL